MKRVLKWCATFVAAAAVGFCVWMYAAPPELLRVAANYAAKIVCSSSFLSGREPQRVMEADVREPGHPVLRYVHVSVNHESGRVEAKLFGIFRIGLAIHREGFGCTCVPDGDLEALVSLTSVETPSRSNATPWSVSDNEINSKLESVLNEEALVGPGVRAVVVVKNGGIVGERYAPGFDANMRLLGWSMTKTVTSAIVGRLISENRTTEDASDLFPSWRDDHRREITLSDLLGMSSGLRWDEGYGSVSDVTRMLYLEGDMARFASNAKLDDGGGGSIGKKFVYSSGTTVLVSRYWQSLFDTPGEALNFPYRELFSRIGMDSMVMEVDTNGTFTGSSYAYATARDWARFGQFLLNKGKWNEQQLLPRGYVDWMTTPNLVSDGTYGNGHVWTSPPNAPNTADDAYFDHRAFWLAGHDGQSVAVLPDENIVVVRLGMTPSQHNYQPAPLVDAVAKALAE